MLGAAVSNSPVALGSYKIGVTLAGTVPVVYVDRRKTALRLTFTKSSISKFPNCSRLRKS